jgi:hypothetical protein
MSLRRTEELARRGDRVGCISFESVLKAFGNLGIRQRVAIEEGAVWNLSILLLLELSVLVELLDRDG